MTGTDRKIDTPMARERSWIVRDNDDKPWGPFGDAGQARAWAQKKWPEIPEYDESNHDGHGCWEIEMLWVPV